MSEKDLSSNHYQTLQCKNLSSQEEGIFNIATNKYIQELSQIDPVLAGCMKRTIQYAYGSLDESTFNGTQEELYDYISKVLPKEPQSNGFAALRPISSRLASWLNVDHPLQLTGPQLTRLVWDTLKQKKLVYQKDIRVFRTDQETAELFGLNMEVVNNSTSYLDEDGFNFRNFKRHIEYVNRID